jgi:hypothetical protein
MTDTTGTDTNTRADDLRLLVHTPDSWARAVAAAAIEEASTRDGFADGPVDVDATITVRRRAPATDDDSHVVLGVCIGIAGHIYCWGLTEHTAG